KGASDAIVVDPYEIAIDPNLETYCHHKEYEQLANDTKQTRVRKTRIRNALVPLLSKRIKFESESQSELKNVVCLGQLGNGSQFFYVTVDEEIMQIISHESTAPTNTGSNPSVTEETKKGDNLIVSIDNNGNLTFISSNFGKAKVIAMSIGDIKASNGQTINQLVDYTCQQNGIDTNRIRNHKRAILTYLRHKIINMSIPINSPKNQDERTENINPIELAQRRISTEYPNNLLESLQEGWYQNQAQMNKNIIINRVGNPLSIPKVAEWFGEPLTDYILNNPGIDPFEILAEYKVLTIDLPKEAEEKIRKVGMGILGDSAEEIFGELYLRYFALIDSMNWNEINQITNSFNEGFRDRIDKEITNLTKQVNNPKDRKRFLARHLASISFDYYVFSIGKSQFDMTKAADFTLNQDRAIAKAVNKQTRNSEKNHPRFILEEIIRQQQEKDLGAIVVRQDIESLTRMKGENGESLLQPAEFRVLPEYKVTYPEIVITALKQLYAEYNEAFKHLVERNREFDNDYMFVIDEKGIPINGWVQIDMVGLPEGFLEVAQSMPLETVKEILRGKIFEIENSLAMYQLLMKMFSGNEQASVFEQRFRASLDEVRNRHAGRKIILLAVTEQKYHAMRESEFGKRPDESLSDKEVKMLSGFDKFMGPKEFKSYLDENNGKCPDLIYVRSSDPISKLIDPTSRVQGSLLEDPIIRGIVKAQSLTFNIDNPEWPVHDKRRINDTKGYLAPIGMALEISSIGDLDSDEVEKYLENCGINPALIAHRMATIRAKPRVGTYGCYGHHRVDLGDSKAKSELAKDLKIRGKYVIQPEMSTPHITNTANQETYAYIDRVFFTTNGREYKFMGGFRSLMPTNTEEYIQGRNHGSKYTVWSEILGDE
ncbi:MAG: hypothetical protein NZM26_05325, partial [Patescibacteria group bacterium]|nr:hypothetical protein [Patescibacteria group bacterium]